MNKQNKILTMQILMLAELIVGKYAPGKFDEEEKRELTKTIMECDHKVSVEFLDAGINYIGSEAPCLEDTPVKWLTSRDLRHLLEARKEGSQLTSR
jgi:hypothetical protein